MICVLFNETYHFHNKIILCFSSYSMNALWRRKDEQKGRMDSHIFRTRMLCLRYLAVRGFWEYLFSRFSDVNRIFNFLRGLIKASDSMNSWWHFWWSEDHNNFLASYRNSNVFWVYFYRIQRMLVTVISNSFEEEEQQASGEKFY